MKIISMANKPRSIDDYRGVIYSKSGKWIGGQDVIIHGHSLFSDLFNQASYMQIIVLNATGKLVSKRLANWLENNFMCMSYPDSRIWCNQVGAYAGISGTSPSAATVSGILAADSRAYGGSQTTKLAMQALLDSFNRHINGESLEDIISSAPLKHGKPALIGFVRPVDKKDERITPHIQMSKQLGFGVGQYMEFAMELSQLLEAKFSSGINIGGYTAAFLLDQGFTPEEGYRIKAGCVASGVTACYIDNYKTAAEHFLPMKCVDISYTGKNKRKL
ncbi:hypothetical protein ACMZOO_11635 [Catenovulum sp. SX2]|uniref:hypothetical protein n=1 Tax=Catenovulum sp. SX2 TaxID=3398614 RepID=UPI003F831E53